MYVAITLNPKHESDRINAFMESLKIHEHQVILVYGESDLKDPKAEPSLENLGVTKYLQNYCAGIVYEPGDGSRVELFKRVNTPI